MNLKNLLILMVMGFALNLQAQSYSFSVSTDTYTDLVGSISLNNGMTWDDPEFFIPIGFEFEYFDQTISELYIEEDGLGAFLSTDTSSSGLKTFLIPYGADIIDRGYDFNSDTTTTGSQSNISYLIEGAPGSRIFKLEWNNVGFYSELEDDGVSSDFANFQLWLYEADNVIEMHYGETRIDQPDLSFDFEGGPAIILIEEYDLDNEVLTGEGLCLQGDGDDPSLRVLNNIDSLTFLESIMPSGTIYRFTRTTTSVAEKEDLDINISLFPNPVADKFTLSYDESKIDIQSISIYDINGRMMANIPYTDNTINTTLLAAGTYTLQIHAKEGTLTKKLLKR